MKLNKSAKNLNYVIGLGKSGFWAAKFLNSKNKRVIVIESNNNKDLYACKKKLEEIGIEVHLNKSFEFKVFANQIDNIESIIVSPGISLENTTIKQLREQGIKITGEVNIGWENLKKFNWVGITGTNGKTTVTHLLSHILRRNNLNAPAVGNIGTPICKYAYHQDYCNNIDWLIAELSSYQIEIAKTIQPKIGIWTTFTPDHLERHKTLENYFKIKNNLLQKSEYRIYNYDDKYLREASGLLSAGTWITSNSRSEENKQCDFWIDSDGFIIEKEIKLFNLGIFKLRGQHNIQNLLLAIAAARKIGLSGEQIKNSLKSFEQLPHRLETFLKNQNIEIINDSKATNFESTVASINAINNAIILISGGRLKDGNYKSWVEIIIKKIDTIFLYGESASFLKNCLLEGGFKKKIFISYSLKDVVEEVVKYTRNEQKKIILFSPSCSSFDQFKDFEERGESFKDLMRKSQIINQGRSLQP